MNVGACAGASVVLSEVALERCWLKQLREALA